MKGQKLFQVLLIVGVAVLIISGCAPKVDPADVVRYLEEEKLKEQERARVRGKAFAGPRESREWKFWGIDPDSGEWVWLDGGWREVSAETWDWVASHKLVRTTPGWDPNGRPVETVTGTAGRLVPRYWTLIVVADKPAEPCGPAGCPGGSCPGGRCEEREAAGGGPWCGESPASPPCPGDQPQVAEEPGCPGDQPCEDPCPGGTCDEGTEAAGAQPGCGDSPDRPPCPGDQPGPAPGGPAIQPPPQPVTAVLPASTLRTIRVEKVYVRATNHALSPIVDELNEGDTVDVMEVDEANGRTRVRTPGGKEGWIDSGVIRPAFKYTAGEQALGADPSKGAKSHAYTKARVRSRSAGVRPTARGHAGTRAEVVEQREAGSLQGGQPQAPFTVEEVDRLLREMDELAKKLRRPEFFNALITEITLPACDAGTTKDPCYMTVKFSPEPVVYPKGSGTAAGEYGKKEQKLWVPASFRFESEGDKPVKVQRAGPFTLKRSVEAPGPTAALKFEPDVPGTSQFRVVTTDALGAEGSPRQPMSGALVVRDPDDRHELARVSFRDLRLLDPNTVWLAGEGAELRTTEALTTVATAMLSTRAAGIAGGLIANVGQQDPAAPYTDSMGDIIGTNGRDIIVNAKPPGLAIFGQGGDDTIWAGPVQGDATVGPTSRLVFGGPGDDTVIVLAGDVQKGGTLSLYGNAGKNTVILVGPGWEVVGGGPGLLILSNSSTAPQGGVIPSVGGLVFVEGVDVILNLTNDRGLVPLLLPSWYTLQAAQGPSHTSVLPSGSQGGLTIPVEATEPVRFFISGAKEPILELSGGPAPSYRVSDQSSGLTFEFTPQRAIGPPPTDAPAPTSLPVVSFGLPPAGQPAGSAGGDITLIMTHEWGHGFPDVPPGPAAGGASPPVPGQQTTQAGTAGTAGTVGGAGAMTQGAQPSRSGSSIPLGSATIQLGDQKFTWKFSIPTTPGELFRRHPTVRGVKFWYGVATKLGRKFGEFLRDSISTAITPLEGGRTSFVLGNNSSAPISGNVLGGATATAVTFGAGQQTEIIADASGAIAFGQPALSVDETMGVLGGPAPTELLGTPRGALTPGTELAPLGTIPKGPPSAPDTPTAGPVTGPTPRAGGVEAPPHTQPDTPRPHDPKTPPQPRGPEPPQQPREGIPRPPKEGPIGIGPR